MRNLQSALNHPRYYLLVQFLTGAMRARKTCIEAYAECKSGQRVLDVGCGPRLRGPISAEGRLRWDRY